jgi:DNA-binding GntR family transcriptional regulator
VSSNPERTRRFDLKRNYLKDQASESLRELFLEGAFPPGSKIPARKVMELLGIGRMPARDALLELERDGLVTNKTGGRYYVVELDEQTLNDLYDARLMLEKRAVELASWNAQPERRAALSHKVEKMKDAYHRKDFAAMRKADIELHRLIWRQLNNPVLEKILNSIGDLIWFGNSRFRELDEAEQLERWSVLVDRHGDLVDRINSGETRAALELIGHHLQGSRRDSLSLLSSKGAA